MILSFRTLASFALALCACILGAQGPGRLPMRHYGNEEGLASEVVTAMAQTTDGLLWAGTEAGLVYFEGHRFAPYTGALPSPLVTDLFADSDGSLWVATVGGVARIQDRKTRILGEAEGLNPGGFQKVGRDALGHLWVLGTNALYVEDGPMKFIQAPALPVPGRPVQLYVDPAHEEILAITSRHILEGKAGHWESLQEPPLGPGEELLNLARDGAGAIWVRSSVALWLLPKGGAWRKERTHMTGGFSFSSRLDRDSQGGIWFEDADGLWHMNGEHREKLGLPSDDAKGGMVDREGGIWIRSDHGVIRTLGRGLWKSYDMRDGLATTLAWAALYP